MFEALGLLGKLVVFFKPFATLFGFTTLAVVLAALAVIWFIPPLRRTAIVVAAAALLLFVSFHYGYGRGDRDGAARVATLWNQANQRAEAARQAREREVAEQAEREKQAAIGDLQRQLEEAEKNAEAFDAERRRLADAACRLDRGTIERLPAIQ
jgi:hypothetical protein